MADEYGYIVSDIATQENKEDEYGFTRQPSGVITSTPSPATSGSSAKKTNRPSWDMQYKGFTFKLTDTKVPGGEKLLTLFVNPEELTQTEPPRLTVIQTKGGAAVTNFGQGLKQITLRGITGYWPRHGNKTGSADTGQNHFQDLRAMFRMWEKDHVDKPDKVKLEFYNWQDEEAFEIVPNAFSLTRSVSRPLLYQYNISFTVIRNLQDKRMSNAWRNDQVNSYNSEDKPQLIKNSLDVQLAKIKILDNSLGGFIKKGGQFLNNATSLWTPITSVIKQVQNLSMNIGTFAKGATNFITMPFEIVKGMANSISSVITSLSSVANIPHEMCQAFKEMECAINGIQASWFSGFSNPDLFDGASGCGTTVGISPAPVSTYSNSFTSTSVQSSLLPVSETFPPPSSGTCSDPSYTTQASCLAAGKNWSSVSSPSQIITLNQDPIQVSGVYLSSDINRTGQNFLDSSSGNQVRLTDIPTSSVVVDYVALNPMESNQITLKASTSQIVKLGDTLERIALQVYGDASLWKRIALFNDLEYPFISLTPIFDKEKYATGTIRFYRQNGYTSDIVIPENYYVYVPYQAIIGTWQLDFTVDPNPSRAYDSNGDAITGGSWILLSGKNYIDIPITAVYYGEIGNVASNIIVGPYGDSTWKTMDSTFQSTYYKITGISKILNPSSLSGGKIWKVFEMGDIIQIPQDTSSNNNLIIGAKQSYEELFGVDINLDRNGEIDSVSTTSKDLKLVSGVPNLVQALRNRIATSRNFYVYHDEYGTNLPRYIGMKNVSYWDGIIKWDITTAILDDPRISDLNNLNMVVSGDTVGLDFDAIPINEKASIPINMIV